MSAYVAITDRSNMFNISGLSDEVRAMLDYLLCAKEAGLDVVATSTTDHAIKTSSGNTSRHRMVGTNGEGLAIDCRLRRRGNDIHRAVFDIFVPVELHLQELIYAGARYNIKAGKRVAPYAVASHHDHVHVAVTKGTFVAWPAPKPAPTPLPTKENPDVTYRYGFDGKQYTTNLVHRQHWEHGGPGFTIMVNNTVDLGTVPQDFHESLKDAG